MTRGTQSRVNTREQLMNSLRMLGAAGFLMTASLLHAAEWPSRPIVVLDGFQPGGGTDVFMRLMAVQMTKTFGQPVVVENRSGASGQTRAVNRAPACGM